MRDRRVFKKSHTRVLPPSDPPKPGQSTNMNWGWGIVGQQTAGATDRGSGFLCCAAPGSCSLRYAVAVDGAPPARP